MNTYDMGLRPALERAITERMERGASRTLLWSGDYPCRDSTRTFRAMREADGALVVCDGPRGADGMMDDMEPWLALRAVDYHKLPVPLDIMEELRAMVVADNMADKDFPEIRVIETVGVAAMNLDGIRKVEFDKGLQERAV